MEVQPSEVLMGILNESEANDKPKQTAVQVQKKEAHTVRLQPRPFSWD